MKRHIASHPFWVPASVTAVARKRQPVRYRSTFDRIAKMAAKGFMILLAAAGIAYVFIGALDEGLGLR